MSTSLQDRSGKSRKALGDSVLATSRILGLYGWDESAAEEYCRPILKDCGAADALEAFRRLRDQEPDRMPAVSDVIAVVRSIRPSPKKTPETSGAIILRGDSCYAGDHFIDGVQAVDRVRKDENRKPLPDQWRTILCGCRQCDPDYWCRFQGCEREARRGMDYCDRHQDEPEAHGVDAVEIGETRSRG